MRSNAMNLKGKTGGRMAFEMKHKVVLSLNKLADRDTYQIGVEELEKIAENLAPEMISPFLSCITDTDSEQKSAVRKECVKLMGTLARFHGSLLTPYMVKMVASIVKRLKDPDSVVRDACVETCGVLATSIRSYGAGGEGGGSAFVTLVRPLFEALGEQNRYVQAGSALCLGKVIDESTEHPSSILAQMLARVVKLLKNPHFMAKPAVIELIRSIIQAGGASTEHALSAALTCITDALKSNDWTTRRASSVALASIAVTNGYLLGSFKSSCILSLESCRFDKVKPVRDAIMHAIQCWKALPGSDSPEPSEGGSATKENFCGDYHEVTSVRDGGYRDTSSKMVRPAFVLSGNSICSTKKRAPLAVRSASSNNVANQHHMKSNDWHKKISLPKGCSMPLVDGELMEPNRSFIAKDDKRRAAESKVEVNYDYGSMEDKPEYSSVSDLSSKSYVTKHTTATHEYIEDHYSANITGTKEILVPEEPESGHCRYQERKSLDSTVTDLGSEGMHSCCLHAVNDLAFIRKKLLEIETKQANLLDLLQLFMGNSADNLSMVRAKMHNLEHAVDKIAHCITQSESLSCMPSSKLLKNQSVSLSPRLSISTPRSSVDADYKQQSLSHTKHGKLCGGNVSSRGRSSTSVKEGAEIWRDHAVKRSPLAKGTQNNSGRSIHSSKSSRARDSKDRLSVSASNDSDLHTKSEIMIGFSKMIDEFISAGDMESAYVEALCSGDELSVIELMDRTGPVLDRLSPETANEVLRVLATWFLDQKFLDSTVSWLQQVVDLSSSHGPRNLFLSARAQKDFLFAVEEVTTRGLFDSVESISISHLASKLSKVCEDVSCRALPTKGPRGSKNVMTASVC
ncbi:TORTIFOLIA1-like protein 2 [Typha angustifolia]|uniref:TORTIFOLIA1-like protein 2 n=1 Tax=Typha angustifolia TaxID=59011 RepID=UPI003C2C9F96